MILQIEDHGAVLEPLKVFYQDFMLHTASKSNLMQCDQQHQTAEAPKAKKSEKLLQLKNNIVTNKSTIGSIKLTSQ